MFLLLYVALSVGMNIIVHTCGGVSEALLVTTEVKDPCVCGDEMPMADQPGIGLAGMCCKTELKTVILDDSQNISIPTIEEKLVAIHVVLFTSISPLDVQCSSFVITDDTSPPPNKYLYISNSVFLI